MKRFITILIFSISIPIWGQNLSQKEGVVRIKMISHTILRDKNDNLIKKISNMANRPYRYLYLDTLGNLIKEVGYGNYHNTDLRILDYVTIHKYEESKIIESIKYEIYYDGDTSPPRYRTEYFHNEKGQVIKEVEKYSNDSIFMQLDYAYDSAGNQIKIDFNDNTYYIRTFDDKGRILSLQQFYKNNLRWEYLYTYIKTSRIGNFKTYYNDGKEDTRREIVLYKKGNPKRIEELCISKHSGLSELKKYSYNQSGLITRVKCYRKFGCEEDDDDDYKEKYKLEYYINVKTKIKCKTTKQLVKKIYKTILNETP